MLKKGNIYMMRQEGKDKGFPVLALSNEETALKTEPLWWYPCRGMNQNHPRPMYRSCSADNGCRSSSANGFAPCPRLGSGTSWASWTP